MMHRRNSILVDFEVVGFLLLLVLLHLIAGCGTISSGAPDAGVGGAGVGGAGVGGASVGGIGGAGAGGSAAPDASNPTCEPGCVPACGQGPTSTDTPACRACTVVDGGNTLEACGPQGSQVCCRFSHSGLPYCGHLELCP